MIRVHIRDEQVLADDGFHAGVEVILHYQLDDFIHCLI